MATKKPRNEKKKPSSFANHWVPRKMCRICNGEWPDHGIWFPGPKPSGPIASALNDAERTRVGIGVLDLTEEGVDIYLVDVGGWLRVMIDIKEETTSNNMRKVIPRALLWRNELRQWQGPWIRGGKGMLLGSLCFEQKGGLSYAKLAKRINEQIFALLREYAVYRKELQEARPKGRSISDFYRWRPGANQFAFDHARDLLRAFCREGHESGEWLEIVRKEIDNSLSLPSTDYCPVSRSEVILALRQWRKKWCPNETE